ncbi:MAG TPA: hypothetical protein VIM30_08795 [Candidatus Limnocylindrales bacterium]|jgi:hypothetical protein
MTLQLHRPDGKGGLERRPVQDRNWRNQLRSPRWGTNVGRRKRLPELANAEMNPTPRMLSVLVWVGLAALTFGILVVGYGIGFWHPGV